MVTQFLLRVLLSAGLVCLAGSVWAEDAAPVPVCKSTEASIREAHSELKFVDLTPTQAETFRKFAQGEADKAETFVVAVSPDHDTVAVIGFDKNGCTQGKGVIDLPTLAAILGQPS